MKSKMLFIVLMATICAVAQPPETLWTRTYGWGGSHHAYSVQQAWGGGFIVAGYGSSSGYGSEFYVVRNNDSGDTLWTRSYGWELDDVCYDLQKTSDRRYILAGVCNRNYYSSPHVGDYCLVKIDSVGDTLWTRSYTKYNLNEAFAVQQTFDNGFILVGSAYASNNYDWFIVKTDSMGDTLWTRTLGNSPSDRAYSVQQTTDGGYIIAGSGNTIGEDITDIYIMKLTESGNLQWERTYGGNRHDYAYSVQQTIDGGYIVTGRIKYFIYNYDDFFLLKTDSFGDSMWMQIYEGLDHDAGNSVTQTEDGGYIIAGYTYSFGLGGSDCYVVRTDSVGDTLWTKTYGGYGWDRLTSVIIVDDGGYIAAGESSSFGGWRFYVVRIGPDGISIAPSAKTSIIPSTLSLHPPYPNPFNALTTIAFTVPTYGQAQLAIYNILGQQIALILNDQTNPGSYSVVWDAEDLPTGIYFCRLEMEGFNQTRKLLLLK